MIFASIQSTLINDTTTIYRYFYFFIICYSLIAPKDDRKWRNVDGKWKDKANEVKHKLK